MIYLFVFILCVYKIGGQLKLFFLKKKYVLVWHNIFGKIFLSSEDRDTAMEN